MKKVPGDAVCVHGLSGPRKCPISVHHMQDGPPIIRPLKDWVQPAPRPLHCSLFSLNSHNILKHMAVSVHIPTNTHIYAKSS